MESERMPPEPPVLSRYNSVLHKRPLYLHFEGNIIRADLRAWSVQLIIPVVEEIVIPAGDDVNANVNVSFSSGSYASTVYWYAGYGKLFFQDTMLSLAYS